MEAIERLESLPMTKSEISYFVEQAKEQILNGYQDPLKIEGLLKGIEEMVKAIRSDAEIREAVLKEAAKYGKKFSKYGVEYQITERRNYDFTTTGDSYYLGLKDAEKTAKEGIKEREQFLKSIPQEGIVTTDGEILNPAAFTTTTVLTIKL